jgi:hypothetical protein
MVADALQHIATNKLKPNSGGRSGVYRRVTGDQIRNRRCSVQVGETCLKLVHCRLWVTLTCFGIGLADTPQIQCLKCEFHTPFNPLRGRHRAMLTRPSQHLRAGQCTDCFSGTPFRSRTQAELLSERWRYGRLRSISHIVMVSPGTDIASAR